jgi:AcrR family transcriptional regulator
MSRAKNGEEAVRQPYHHGDLRAALMQAALELIERDGVRGFSLKDAAALAGVSTAAPYRHFADKSALLGELAGEGFSLFNQALAAAYRGFDDPGLRMVELGIAYVRFAERHRSHFRVMFGMSGADRIRPDEGTESGFRLLVAGVVALLPLATPDERKDLVVAYWSVVHGFAVLQMEGAFARTIEDWDGERQLRRTLMAMTGIPAIATPFAPEAQSR